MVINNRVYEQIKQFVDEQSSEVGGLLGAVDSVITSTIPDSGLETVCGCEYRPNTRFLNAEIKKWNNRGISLAGIYHTHFHCVETLSEGDCEYAKTILLSMPENIDSLYFPVVVLPEKGLIPYLCRLCNGQLHVTREKLVVNKEG